MTNILKYIGIAIAGIVVGLFFSASSNLGGIYHNTMEYFAAGITVTGNIVGNVVGNVTGNVTGAVTGSTGTFSSTLGVTGTTTLSNGLNLNKVNLGCVSFYATSTATRLHFKFEATAATSTFPGAMMASYGACAN